MPASCIAPRDFVGYRYLVKRALYVSHLAKNLLNQKVCVCVLSGYCISESNDV